MRILFFIISFFSSVIGSICGIGGGIIIKPLLDLSALVSLSSIGFYSCCTVLAMSAYNVLRTLGDKSSGISTKTGTPLALGAALGGVIGNRIFALLKLLVGRDDLLGASQALLLLLLTLGTLLYTLNRDKIRAKQVSAAPLCFVIGLALGCMSSFLGIGGGPFNLVVLHYFFSMDTKKAVSNSLYIILFSQIANLLTYFVDGAVPALDGIALVLMMAGGVAGGIVGRAFSKKNSAATVDKLYIALMVLIVLICIYNAIKYLYL